MRSTDHKRITGRLAVAAVIWLVLLGSWLYYRQATRPPEVPDETAAGLELLSRKFAGPGYFHLEPVITNLHGASPEPHYKIGVLAAEAQISRVLTERNLSTNRVAELESLIERLAEPSKSRAVGESEVNVLRLNLALDDLASKP